MSFPRASRPQTPSATVTESRALAFALGAFVIGFVSSQMFFAGQPVALSGAKSVGVTAGIVAGLAAIVAFASGYVRFSVATHGKPTSTAGKWRTGLDAVALTVTVAVVVVLLVGTGFAVLQQALRDFMLDASTAAVVVAVVGSIAGYTVASVAPGMSTRTIANLLAAFLVSGGLASALSAQDAHWWQRNFSALGRGDGFSSYTFNLTIVFAGLVIVTLTHHLARDIRARSGEALLVRIRVLRIWLILVGVLLAGVGVVSVDEAEVVHTVFAITMFVAFAGLVVVSPLLVPWLPRSFRIVSALVVAAFGLVVVLMWPVGYFNLTAMELIGLVLLLAWLMLFVRAVAAAVDDEAGSELEKLTEAADASARGQNVGEDH